MLTKPRLTASNWTALIDLTSWLQWGSIAYSDARYPDGGTHFTQVDAVTGAINPDGFILDPTAMHRETRAPLFGVLPNICRTL